MLPIRIGRLKLAAAVAIIVVAAATVGGGLDWRLAVVLALALLLALGLASLILDSHRVLRSELRRLHTDVRALHGEARDDSRGQLAEIARWGGGDPVRIGMTA